MTARQLAAWRKKLDKNSLPDVVLDVVEEQIKSRRRGRITKGRIAK